MDNIINNGKKYSIVLAGGGGKGAYQIGALKALKEMGIMNDVRSVAGTSIGAVNSSFVASDSLDKAEKEWRNISTDDFIEFDDNGFDIGKEGDGMLSRDGLKKIISRSANLKDMSDSDIAFYITICTKLPDGTIIPIYERMNGKSPEQIMTYIMASSAIPFVYDNVIIEGNMYFDGGIRDNTPIKPLFDEGAKEIIVISNDYRYEVPDMGDDVTVYPIVPSHNLDVDTICGTADLSVANAAYRIELGYLDTKCIMKALMEGKSVPNLSGMHDLAMQARKRVELTASVNSNMEGLARILHDSDFLN